MQKWNMEEWEGEKTKRDGGWGGREVGGSGGGKKQTLGFELIQQTAVKNPVIVVIDGYVHHLSLRLRQQSNHSLVTVHPRTTPYTVYTCLNER